MSAQTRSKSLWQALPLVGFFISEWRVWREEQMQACYPLAPMPEDASVLQPYPLDMWPLLALPLGTLDEVGVPYNAATQKYPATYHPTTIAQYSLAHWNAYLATGIEKHKRAFMIQAQWLVDQESRLTDDMGYWSYYDQSFGDIANLFYHSLHIRQLKALAQYTDWDHCAAQAIHWEGYQRSRISPRLLHHEPYSSLAPWTPVQALA